MFENMTFENILGSMLASAQNEIPDLDVRTGSVVYTTLAPIAMELETVYRQMSGIVDETFVGTASRNYLVKHGKQLSLDIGDATYSHFKAEFNIDVPLGSRFSLGTFKYSVIAKLKDAAPVITGKLNELFDDCSDDSSGLYELNHKVVDQYQKHMTKVTEYGYTFAIFKLDGTYVSETAFGMASNFLTKGDLTNLDGYDENVGDNSVVQFYVTPSFDELPQKYYEFELLCETSGTSPNNVFGKLVPITYVGNNLSHAEIVDTLVYGEDEEPTEAYRERLQVRCSTPPHNGNVSQYMEWLDEYDGIGKYKIIPCWNEATTVKLIVLDPDNRAASDELVEQVQQHFDPVDEDKTLNDDKSSEDYPQGRGMGNGQAPIGAIVTVVTAEEVKVKIECELTLKEGYSSPTGVGDAVKQYLDSITFDKNTIDYMAISAKIHNADCVDGVKSLKITVNDAVMDTRVTPFVNSVTIDENSIAVLDGDSSWGV